MRLATRFVAFATLLAALPAGAVPLSFRGADVEAVGAAHHLIWSPRSNVAELRCDNLGSSGQDGVSFALPPDNGAWSCTFGVRPPGTLAPEECAFALSESAGSPPFATWSFVDGGGFQRCVPDVADVSEWFVDVWNGDELVYSTTSLSPPVVDLPAGVTPTDDGGTVSVISNLRTRINELEARLKALGLLTVNGVAVVGDRVRVGGRATGGKHFTSVKITGRHGGGGGGGGAGGMTIARTTKRFGINEQTPDTPLGLAVDDGNVLASPPGGEPGASVLLGPGMTDWAVSFADLSRPDDALRAWGMTVASLADGAWALGGSVTCVAPSQWTSGPDTMRIAVGDDGSGTGLALSVSNAPGTKGVVTRAYSGAARLVLAEGPASIPASVAIASPPSSFHLVYGDGTVIARCALPPGTTVFAGGMGWPCDSLEFEVGGAPGERCTGLNQGWLLGQLHDRCDVRFAYALHMHQFGRRGGVPVVAAGRARVQPLGGGLVVHGIGSSGEDGVDIGALGKIARVVLKEFFEKGDKPSQLRFTATGTFSDGSSRDVCRNQIRVGGDALGGLVGVRTEFPDQGGGPVFVQLSDGSVWRREECDDGDAEVAVRCADGSFPVVESITFHQDSPWTAWVDVQFRTGGPATQVIVANAGRPTTGLRMWRNRGGEHTGLPSVAVEALQLRAVPPTTPVASPPGTCTIELEGIDVQSAGTGLAAHGPGSTLAGVPVVPTFVRVVADTTGDGRDEDCDGDSADDGLTLRTRKGHTVTVVKVGSSEALHGMVFAADLGPVTQFSDSAGFELVLSGVLDGVVTPVLGTFGGKKGYDHYKMKGALSNANSNPMRVRCYDGPTLVAQFPLDDSLSATLAPAAVCADDSDDDGHPDYNVFFPGGNLVHPPGGGDVACDRVLIDPQGPVLPATFDGGGSLALTGLPPGVPVTGLRLAGMPVTAPWLGVEPGPRAGVFALARPWPNPARGVLRASFALSAPARVRARVLDVSGRVVTTLADGAFAAGEHALLWDGRTRGGTPAPAGVYFVRVERDGREAHAARFTLLR